MAIYSFFSFKIITLITALFGILCLGESSNFSGSFVFGDGLFDAGNNNFIATLRKSDFYPNGIDFGGPTGRFTNGKTLVDILGVLEGVNYASGGAGILNETGKIFVGRINMDAQIDNFESTRQNIISSIGLTATMQLFKKALFFTSIGSNDLLHNYLIPSILSTAYNDLVPPQEFVATLMSKFSLQLTRLHNLGARKIVVLNVGPIGCTPNQRDTNPNILLDKCVVFPNWLAQLFNTQLKSLITELTTTLEGSKLVYADFYNVMKDIIDNYSKYGFENSDSSCCYVAGRFGGLIPCGLKSKLCLERSKYVYWDPYNPSQAANDIIAKSLLDGDTNIISPINVRQLFQS
ncbi:GDSL esterase/lipase At4g16230-like isoform X2 [Humulus lupulus]|uniref:GDSL esterase/lipase At4g16230-like isoform X2 n=1 Tax=Humulus lupulus TaxID=3486 RepID=UPI002B4074A4|nr:GDSL esterase/lipase At4g16230-like isoform X2 [Humulus lupulus]